jgi:methionyl aminopeptidase
MFTRVKTAQEISAMRESGKILATVLQTLSKEAAVGMTTEHLARIAEGELRALGGEPVFKGHPGVYPFPSIICISVNDQVVHGIPGPRELIDGDVLSMDFGVRYKGMITDSARSIVVGSSTVSKDRLLRVTYESMHAGIKTLRDGVRTGTIGAAVEEVLKQNNYGIVRDLVGHGVGHELHEDPNIPNYGKKNTGDTLLSGMTVAIEPMATLGGDGVFLDDDGWTICTKDGSLSAHFEDTVLITDNGFEILTSL